MSPPQVYRAGVQMERISKRREEDYKSVREFYMQSATLLSQKQPESRHIYVVSCLVSSFEVFPSVS